jgi:hypothetical protein
MTDSGNSTNVQALVRAVLDKGNAYNANDAVSQKELYHVAKELVSALQPPLERVAQLSMYEVMCHPKSK